MKTVLHGGCVVTPTQLLPNTTVVLENDRITALLPPDQNPPGADEVIDCTGAWVVPGLIDLHADYIEHMAAPRPTSIMDFRVSLRAAERELLTHGITTMFHSLSFYGHSDFGSNPIRSPENSRKLIEVIHGIPEKEHLLRHRFHARFEIDNVERVQELENLIKDGKTQLVSFMDHSPGQGQYRDLELYKLILKGYRRLNEEDAEQLIHESRGRAKITKEILTGLAELAAAHGVAVASHDDDSIEKLDTVQDIGITISEFPITLDVAREACRRGMTTVAGAPNILLGGSHSGNLSAAEAVMDGCVDILCSDYYPASMLQAIFMLHENRGLGLAQAFALVTLNPAKAVKMDQDYGSVEPGKKADLLVVRKMADGFPFVEEAFVDGERLLSIRYRSSR